MNTKCVFTMKLQQDSKAVTELQQASEANESNIIKSVTLPAIVKRTHSNSLDSSTEFTTLSARTQMFKPSVMSIKSDDQTTKRLENPHGKEIEKARSEVILKGLNLWKTDKNPYSPDETELVKKIALLLSNAYHLSLPKDDVLVLTSNDFSSVVSIIKKLARKVGIAELGAMVLLAIAVGDAHFLRKSGYKNESDFFKQNADLMGISASCARDFATRGRIFLHYRLDILNGIDDVTGIPLEIFSNSCMAKLTLYEKAVEALGSKQALVYLKKLSFREFQKKILSESSMRRSLKGKKRLKELKQSELDYDHRIKELDLMPNEKRLLRIKAKKGIVVTISQNLTDHQVNLIEARYRERRVKRIRDFYKMKSKDWVHYKPADPENPLKIDDLCFHNGIVWEKIIATRENYMEKAYYFSGEMQQRFENRIFNYADIVSRIHDGISQIQPARRTIAVLLFRLVNEKAFKNKWKRPKKGVEYKSFKDFAIEELGLRENYRDYLAVGKVLNEYHYFLDHLTDVDTEDTFLKLRYLPDALKTHKDDEYLVLARLRSLSVREFKRFSINPDFEINFGRRLTKKELDDCIKYFITTTRNELGLFKDNKLDFIEAYHENDLHLILQIADKVIEETSIAIIPTASMIDETTNDGVHTIVDDSNHPLGTSAA